MYIGVTLLSFPEHEVWKMTPYKIITLFNIHKRFNPDKFIQEKSRVDPIDEALGGL